MQTIEDLIAVRQYLLTRIGLCGVTGYAVPFDRIARTDRSRCVDDIHLVGRQNQAINRLATQAVGVSVVIGAGRTAGLPVPIVTVACLDMLYRHGGVRTRYVEREHHDRVTSVHQERVAVRTPFRVLLAVERVGIAVTDGSVEIGYWDVTYRQMEITRDTVAQTVR